MINSIKIQGVSGYPERIDGTNEWFSIEEGADSFCDVAEAEDCVRAGGTFPGRVYHLVHFPEGTVHSPFALRKNVYVEAPIWNEGTLHFFAVDFSDKQIRIYEYAPETKALKELAALPLSSVENCRSLWLRVKPLMLCQNNKANEYKIHWPQKRTYKIGENEGLMFRDGEDLYFSEWGEDPEYYENVIVRDYNTGAIQEKYRGYLARMAEGIYWRL